MFNSYDPMKLVKEMHKVNKVVSVQTGKPYEEDLSEQVEEIEPVLEKWQVTFSDGSINEIKLICETDDETVKKEFSFKNIPLVEGETINTSTSLDNISLNDFVLIKELLSGKVQMSYPPLINLDSTEREKLKKYYESGSWLMGLMWANALMGGY